MNNPNASCGQERLNTADQLNNALPYQLEMGSCISQSNRWSDTNEDGLSPSMELLKNVVQEALESGVFYTDDMFSFVDSRLGGGLTDEQRNYRIDEVERGYWGMEIYYARDYVQRKKIDQENKDQYAKAKKITIGTVYKNISIFMKGKRYNFSTLKLLSFDDKVQSLHFLAKRRGVKGSATLKISASGFLKAVEESSPAITNALPPNVKDNKSLSLF
jgi:hypothetical protein